MRIRKINGERVMQSSLVCENYMDAGTGHFVNSFEKVGDNDYKCMDCGSVMTIKEPVIVHDSFDGRLHMQVASVPKREED